MDGTLRMLGALAVLVSALTGCAKLNETAPSASTSPSSSTSAIPSSIPGSSTLASPTLSLPTAPAGSLASEAKATAFLQSLEQGAFHPEDFTPAFLRLIATPELPSDVQRGYDEVEAKRWFESMTVKCDPPSLRAEENGVAITIASCTGASPGRIAFRMVGTPAGWKVDWFQRLPASSATSGGHPFASFAAECALASILNLSGDDSVARAALFLSPALLRKLGEPTFDSDKPRGYNVGSLQRSLRGLGHGAVSGRLQHSASETYRAELIGGATPRTLILKLTNAATPGAWLVDDITVE